MVEGNIVPHQPKLCQADTPVETRPAVSNHLLNKFLAINYTSLACTSLGDWHAYSAAAESPQKPCSLIIRLLSSNARMSL